MVPDAVNRAVERSTALEIGQGAIELAHREQPVPAPSKQQRVVRLDLQSTREGGDRLAKLPRPGLGHAEIDDARHVLRVGVERGARFRDRLGIGLRAILHPVGRPVLHRLRARLASLERRADRDRCGER